MTGILKLMSEYNLTEEEVREKFNLYHQVEPEDYDDELCEVCEGYHNCCCTCIGDDN